MTDFEKIYKILEHSNCEIEVDCPHLETDEFLGINGCISIWDKNGTNSLDIYFNPNGSFRQIFIND